MQTSSQPKLLPVPFANAGSKQPIPNESQIGITAGRASYTDGFPPLTRTPLAAGGVPPFGTDFNGVLNDITAAVRWSQSGAGYPFDSAFNTAIGGYPKGARIPNSTLDGFWLNTIDSNTANPEVTGAATTGWVPAENYGVTAITGLSGSSITLTTLQASKERITLSGALTSNINLVVPAWMKRWTIINNCAGSFFVTVKTPSGSGVAVANGSSAIVQGDGTNIIPGYSMGDLINVQTFNSSGPYTPTPGTKSVVVEVQAAGGGSGGVPATGGSSVAASGGGGSGAYAKARFTSGFSGISITVGGGGAAGATGGGAGGNGGASSFGSLVVCPGGIGGQSTGTTAVAFPTSRGGSADTATPTGGNIISARGKPGGGTTMINTTVANLGFGAPSYLSNGAPLNNNGDYGSGAGGIANFGSMPAAPGYAGGNGVVIVWEYA